MNINEWHVSHVRIERNVLCFKPNEYYNHRKPKLGLLKCNWNDLHICKGLYGESKKLRKATLENCLPELQWWFFSAMCGFLADLACHSSTAYSLYPFPRLVNSSRKPSGLIDGKWL